MRLLLASKTSPWATIFRTEDDEPAYKTKVLDSSLIGGSTTAIYKIPLGQGAKVEPDQTESMIGMPSLTTTELATVKIRLLHADEYTVNGHFVKVTDFYKKVGLGRWYGRDRIWTGPDGVRYRWKIKDTKPELCLNDGDKRIVAKFHREHSGRGSRKACPASLEIFGEPTAELVDMIVVTFIHLEKRRAEEEELEDEIAIEVLKAFAFH